MTPVAHQVGITDWEAEEMRDLALRVARQRGRTREDAEDIAQETVLKLWERATNQGGLGLRSAGAFRSYVAITAANTDRQFIRGTSRRRRREANIAHGDRLTNRLPRRPGVRRGAVELANTVEFADDANDRAFLAHLGQVLPPAQARAVKMVFEDCYTEVETAEELGVSRQAVKASLLRAAPFLRFLSIEAYDAMQRRLTAEEGGKQS